MSSTLPPRAHPDHLRRQARELHRALQRQEAAALARAAPYRLAAPPRLTEAQLVIAREYGFASWPQLMRAVQTQRATDMPEADYVRQVLVARGADPAAADAQGRTPAALAAQTGDVHTLAYLAALGQRVQLDGEARFLAACAAADGDAARAHLAAHPRTIESLGAAALRLLPDQAQRGRHAAVALMLELGWPVATRGDWDASALNQAAFRGDAAMVQLLLAHGARWHEPNGFGGDALGSCLYAGTNLPSPSGDYATVLRLLLADGATPPPKDEWLPEAMQEVLTEAG